MRFTGDFDIERNIDWVEVTENDGICHPSCILWGTRFEDWEMRDRHFVSNTNTVEVHFHTDGSVTGSGWRLEWGMEKFLIAFILLNAKTDRLSTSFVEMGYNSRNLSSINWVLFKVQSVF